MRTLSGVAQDGSGSAALPSKQRTDRGISVPRRTRNLALMGLAAGVIGLVGARMAIAPAPSIAPSTTTGATAAGIEPPLPSPELSAAAPSASPTSIPAGGLAEYAVALHELKGLAPDSAPGSIVDLWVAWDADYARQPQIQPLVKGATVVRFLEPATPEGPEVVVLGVPTKAIGKLMYGDLYGSLAASTPGA